jgi:hypothetical protein
VNETATMKLARFAEAVDLMSESAEGLTEIALVRACVEIYGGGPDELTDAQRKAVENVLAQHHAGLTLDSGPFRTREGPTAD